MNQLQHLVNNFCLLSFRFARLTVFGLPEAKKRNYDAFPASRQPRHPDPQFLGPNGHFVVFLETKPSDGRRTISKIAKIWQPLLDKGLHAFFLVLGCKGAVEQTALVLDSVG